MRLTSLNKRLVVAVGNHNEELAESPILVQQKSGASSTEDANSQQLTKHRLGPFKLLLIRR